MTPVKTCRLVVAIATLLLTASISFAQDPPSGHLHQPDASVQPSSPQGYAPLKVEGGSVAGLALKVSSVEVRSLQRTIRTFGVVTFDETRTSHVHPKVRGTLESVSANFVGKTVKQGEQLAEIYSPAVYAAQLELVAILKQGRGAGDPLFESARRRLQLWDVPTSQIERIVQNQKAARTFTLLAPRSGTVLARQALNGMYVAPETELVVVSDLSVVWALIDLYEGDLPLVRAGTAVKLTIEGVPKVREGQVAFLPPSIDESTRTLKARVVLANEAGNLRPGAFVQATLDVDLGSALVVPSQAVIRAGTRNLVFVVSGEHVEPREVQLGASAGEFVQVLSGLKEGEAVATTAQFLLDSESRLRATSGPGGGHAGH
ncbi:MAG: efflux RND transporter periplasmic adaptor subunit [Myxococcaceae bacterium]|nr:efflux RND transporter periplasmic adaptor subunit [Myxococcaceae bacterium]